MWWLSFDGKLSLPFNESDCLLLSTIGNSQSGELFSVGLGLEPRGLLLAAAGHYQTYGRMATELEALTRWLGEALARHLARFEPIQRQRRKLLQRVQKRRESYLRHLRGNSDGWELRRQLERVLADCARLPRQAKPKRLLKRWISTDLLEQLVRLSARELVSATMFPEPLTRTAVASVEETGDSLAAEQVEAAEQVDAPEALTEKPAALGARIEEKPPTATDSASVETARLPSEGPHLVAFQRLLQTEKLAALRQLAYGASHEINNPLANIAMRAELLLREEVEEQRCRKLQVIRQQALRAHEMISDLMLFANPPRPVLEEIDPASWLEELALELASDVQLAGGDLTASCGISQPIVVDPSQLAEVTRALVRNSLEAQPVGAKVIIRLDCDETGYHSLEVSDNGPGIIDEVARHMFDPFYSSREAGRGLGFGLSKAWRIAESHAGSLDCLSRHPGQTRFRFRWPRLSLPARAA